MGCHGFTSTKGGWLLVCAFLTIHTPAFAHSDTLQLTSAATAGLTIRARIASRVRVAPLEAIFLDLDQPRMQTAQSVSKPVCVQSNDSRYRIRAVNSTPGPIEDEGTLTLSNGISTLTYQAAWDRAYHQPALEFCSDTMQTTTLKLTLPELRALTASPTPYSGALTLLVSME